MAGALCLGLLAWGPTGLPGWSGPAHLADADGAGRAIDAIAALVLSLVGTAGVAALRHGGCPPTLRRPWAGFFLAMAVLGLASVAGLAWPREGFALAARGAAAAASVTLLLAFLAERAQPDFGSAAAVGIGLAFAALGTAWSGLVGDARALLVLQVLPLLLVPAGALGLAGHVTTATDWRTVLALWLAATILDGADAPVIGRWGGLLLLSAAAALPLWRLYRRAPATAGSSPPPSSNRRSTSASTSGS